MLKEKMRKLIIFLIIQSQSPIIIDYIQDPRHPQCITATMEMVLIHSKQSKKLCWMNQWFIRIFLNLMPPSSLMYNLFRSAEYLPIDHRILEVGDYVSLWISALPRDHKLLQKRNCLLILFALLTPHLELCPVWPKKPLNEIINIYK